MKRTISLLLAAMLLLSFAACGKKVTESPVPDNAPEASSSPDKADVSVPATPAPSAEPAPLRSELPAAAKDYDEIFSAISASADAAYPAAYNAVSGSGVSVTRDEMEASDAVAAPEYLKSADAGTGYSGTNVQVSNVDEGDIVKTDGAYIYTVRDGKELLVLKADGPDTEPVAWADVGMSSYSDAEDDSKGYSSEYKYVSEMYVSGDRLAVLGSYNYYRGWMEDNEWRYDSEDYAFVDIYDISDPMSPKLVSKLGQDGSLFGSRLYGGKIYALTRYWVWEQDESNPENYVPCTHHNGSAKLLPAGCIFVCPGASTEYTVVCAYDLTAAELSETQSILGSGDELYMNGDSISVLGSRYETELTDSYTESVYKVEAYSNGSVTDIHRFVLDGGLRFAASGSVPGYIDSQFSADAYNGFFRIVTTRNDNDSKIYTDEKYNFTNYEWGEARSSNGLYILDDALTVVGSVEDLAEGEYICSARFDGDIAYFCTFRTVDPLFAVDLSDPAAPQVLSALKISGFSDYLHPWSGDRLLGFGREADTESGRAEGLKLVMFDTTDKRDVTVENSLELDASYSEALYNHKAFFIDPAKNIIGFLGDNDYYVFSYTPEEGFRERSHFVFEYNEWNVRGLWIGDWAYVVGRETVSVLDMNQWGEPSTVLLGWG